MVVCSSLLTILLIAGAAIAVADNKEPTARLVFTSVLPVLGTWVGTVLAFYFARENLEAATKSALDLTGRETETPVTKVMIPEADFVTLDLAADQKASRRQAHRRAREDAGESSAVAARADPRRGGAVLCVIHDSTLTAYAESQRA